MIKKIIYTVLGVSFVGISTQLLSALLYSDLHAISRTNLGIKWWFTVGLPLTYLIWSKVKVTRFTKFICLVISSVIGLMLSSDVFIAFAVGSVDISTSLLWGSVIYQSVIIPLIQISFCLFALKTVLQRNEKIKLDRV